MRIVGSSQELAKLFDGQARVPHDSTHGESIDGIVSRDRQDSDTVGHGDMFAVTRDAKARFLKSSHRIEMVDTGELGHVLFRDLDFPDLRTLQQFLDDAEVFLYCSFDIG